MTRKARRPAPEPVDPPQATEPTSEPPDPPASGTTVADTPPRSASDVPEVPEEPEEPKERVEKDENGKEIKRTVPFTKDLHCDLTNDELLSRSFELTKALNRDTLLDDLFVKIKKKWKEKLDDSKRHIAEITGVITSRRETRLVQCERVFDYVAFMVVEYRTDTLEKITSRVMTDEERQRILDFGENDPDKELEAEAEEDAPPADDAELEAEVSQDMPPEDDEELGEEVNPDDSNEDVEKEG